MSSDGNPIPPNHDGDNGRGPDGRFRRGHAGGPGRPRNRFALRLSERTFKAGAKVVSASVAEELWTMALSIARGGDGPMIRYLLDRCAGPGVSLPVMTDARELSELVQQEVLRGGQ